MKGKMAAFTAGLVLGSAGVGVAGTQVDRLTQIWLNTDQTNRRIGNPVAGAPNTISGKLDRLQSDVQLQSARLRAICAAANAAC
jgi:hypothetical protein